jgi:dTDP-4-amino-4,6-dideoxygalactose transaminase
MTDIQAAMGLAQLRQLADFQRRRRQIAARYREAFQDIDALENPTERAEVEHAWHLYVLRLRLGALRIGRNRFIEELRARNIGTSVHFIPVHLHPYYRQKYNFRPDDFPVALGNYQRMLSLPIHPRLSDRDVSDVIEAVLDVVSRFAR